MVEDDRTEEAVMRVLEASDDFRFALAEASCVSRAEQLRERIRAGVEALLRVEDLAMARIDVLHAAKE